MFKVYKKKKIF